MLWGNLIKQMDFDKGMLLLTSKEGDKGCHYVSVVGHLFLLAKFVPGL